jgi:hypothetical protein
MCEVTTQIVHIACRRGRSFFRPDQRQFEPILFGKHLSIDELHPPCILFEPTVLSLLIMADSCPFCMHEGHRAHFCCHLHCLLQTGSCVVMHCVFADNQKCCESKAFRPSSRVQVSVESSKELLSALSTSVLQRLRQLEDSKLSLLVLDSAGVFSPLDRVNSKLPTSPRACTEIVLQGATVNGPTRSGCLTLAEVHDRLVASLREISRLPVVTFVTMKCSTQWDSNGMLQYRPYLPNVWEVCVLLMLDVLLLCLHLHMLLAHLPEHSCGMCQLCSGPAKGCQRCATNAMARYNSLLQPSHEESVSGTCRKEVITKC